MTIAQKVEADIDILHEVVFPPSDLYSDVVLLAVPPLETELHLKQIMLLLQSLEYLWKERNDFYAIGNLTVYYSSRQKRSEDYPTGCPAEQVNRGPDFFVVLGTEKKARKSWVVWEEDGKYPDVIVEILSPTTAANDRGLKKEIYQNTFRTSDYFWFDPYSLEFAGFHLLDRQYEPLNPNEVGYLWSKQLGLYLGIREGLLRFFTAQGELVLRPEEVITQQEDQLEEAQRTTQAQEQLEQTQERLEEEAQRATQAQEQLEQTQERLEQEAQKAQRLADKLRELNIDTETI